MKLILSGHDDRYAVEQLLMSLFGTQAEGRAQSSLHRSRTWLTAVTVITLNGKTTRAIQRIKTAQETIPARRRCLQQSLYVSPEYSTSSCILR